ncbi:TetR/AcrR family transcriptional regulator [Marinomonas primoryensis]|jgi:AcrR family transcriptional regulator|uniref:TetR/AcrR family transcriptional regulator n=1 Tax=Marinomonas primoryensis TaxID=178399 RepID=A0A859CT98_9GAMM|nr:TetR/AcrR family transcriptional regulator [Marinomonas primoryensis]QKK79418.1 TetR/AcrR family transcriptional regulator [Marinomonas primoryensis]|tara:strand:- start:3471 stop:4043 length:573 start_codon:yes stop_codon:yes gene_type:complete
MRTIKLPLDNDLRKQSIIDATVQHALTKGFHKASMNEIAKSAELSVGQIYRYFAHKDDIICALVEQFTQRKLQFMASFFDKKDWLDRHFTESNLDNNHMRIMHAEIKAEAARNPVISKIYTESHKRLKEGAITIMKQLYPTMDKNEAMARIEMLITLKEGLLVRWDFQPRPFSKEMRQMYNQILDTILPD